MARRPFLFPVLVLLALLTLSGGLYAQLESGERGIAPLDSSGTFEVTGIHVDVGAKDALSGRYAGWRIAQRQVRNVVVRIGGGKLHEPLLSLLTVANVSRQVAEAL